MIVWKSINFRYLSILSKKEIEQRTRKQILCLDEDSRKQILLRSVPSRPIATGGKKISRVKDSVKSSSSDKNINMSSTQFRGLVEIKGDVMIRESKIKENLPENADFKLLSRYDEIKFSDCIKMDKEKLKEIQDNYDKEKEGSRYGISEADIIEIDITEDVNMSDPEVLTIIDRGDIPKDYRMEANAKDFGETSFSIMDSPFSRSIIENLDKIIEKKDIDEEKLNNDEVIDKVSEKLGYKKNSDNIKAVDEILKQDFENRKSEE